MEWGRAQQACIIISQPSPLQIECIKTDITQRGNNDGSITVNINGGTAPFNYQWSNGATSAQIAQLSAGTYAVTVTDVNDCKSICQAVIVNPPCQIDAGLDKVLVCNGLLAPTTTILISALNSQSWQLTSQPIGANAQVDNNGNVSFLSKVGDYIFELSLINDNSCKDNVKITVPDCTPNCPPKICVGIISVRRL